MAQLKNSMPNVKIDVADLKVWGDKWFATENPDTGKAKEPERFDRHQSVNFCTMFDKAVGNALADMLGDIPVEDPTGRPEEQVLLPTKPDCVEVGPTRVIGGIRPQNYDVAYRPDGVRFAFDSKSLNDKNSVGKNWQNMVNDLSTEAATVHTRFPYAIVAFMVVIPKPALGEKQEANIIRTLERLSTRRDVLDQMHLAESISLVVWDPKTGKIDKNIPPADSTLRIEKFSEKIFDCYCERYKGLPPHD